MPMLIEACVLWRRLWLAAFLTVVAVTTQGKWCSGWVQKPEQPPAVGFAPSGQFDQPDQSSAAPAEPTTGFRCSTRKQEDRVAVQDDEADEQRLLIAVRSPSGIGSAVVERTDGKWPDEVVVRLYLRGLESFRARTGKAELAVSVLSHGRSQRLLRLSVDGRQQEIKPKGPAAVEVHAYEADGKPAEGLPGAGGWFDVRLPRIMLRGNPAELRMDWIDFYRG